ncbi:MAG: universal stress protein [Porticoccaceae bacterium]|nr:universal stress protein [Pseudomonadales bacterium]MCP5170973.1 universal stress protein [Pseudomonadales bacterium]MCP5301789.1 universal stress protein [Pseudomonadales bacterium]
MQKQEKILVVIDPSRDEQPALERAITNAQIREAEEQSHLVLLVTAGRSVGTRNLAWINQLQQSVESEGIDSELIVSWSQEWSANILNTANELHADMVMLPLYDQQTGNQLISDEKWALLRKCESPILLVRPGGKPKRKSILVSVKMQDGSYDDLNQRILERGSWAAWRYGAELHVVNAYSDSMNFPDRGKINNMVKIENDNIHIQQGEPGKVISEVAEKVDADMILVGTKRRSGIKAALRGNTIEKIVGSLSQDVMLMI